ncbi:GNAT family N-acetyltransferase [Actinomycetospora endophytica]|uniref:GNAT family N-acetyltransferase n=1 Tax=Actinomycetospora endophytica TaxID=2291215 RepID=A0ABS8PFZ3_9PSEU|nr:GNAT family N-acetyltransferase [Actinomycetospora endophytica]MCD2197148.1 GNAT family N-acetyltransferase [Actinomycetospora endophytica]
MLRTAGARLLDDRDRSRVRGVLDDDPVATCMVASRVETVGVEPWRLGGELWGVGGRLDGLCFSGANLVPLRGERAAVRAFADRARRHRRTCSSLVGRRELVLPLWEELAEHWGTAREVRPDQPLMAIDGMPSIRSDPAVRQARPDDMERYLPAAIAMFLEEVGVDPRLGDGGAGYRARVGELISSGRAFVRFEAGEVVFKAEVGALSTRVGQIQGVWVHPDWRGRGLGQAGTAAVVEHLVRAGRIASLYVNAFNTPARAAYQRVGFDQVASFATVLF